MRYPDRIAYHFEIDDALRGLVLPKFSIQPLIENYFVHGIDFSRNDNAISVKARVVGKRVEIMIRDNGKGISDQKLSIIQEKLKQQTIELHDSIGLQNVNERLRAYFSPTFLMQVVSNEPSGLTIILSFEKEQKMSYNVLLVDDEYMIVNGLKRSSLGKKKDSRSERPQEMQKKH